MQELIIGIGFLILALNLLDFFHTTISGNGFWKISSILNEALAKLILKSGSKTLIGYSGFVHLLTNVFFWLFFLILGGFLVFASSPEMVVHATTREPAPILDRVYFSCYLISTLGTGEFVPGNTFSSILSGFFSFSGFILLTTALSYLISVNNSLLKKKELALYITGLGESVDELYHYFTTAKKSSILTDRSDAIRNLINSNTSNSSTFPIIRYFLTTNKKHSPVLQLAKLYEVLKILLEDFEKGSVQREEIKSCLLTMGFYLELHKNAPLTFTHNAKDLKKIRKFWGKYQRTYFADEKNDSLFTTALKKNGWSWKEVYRQ